MIQLNRIDHVVLTVASIEATVDFYTRVLGMTAETFGSGRTALRFGSSKFNLHEKGKEFEPKALLPTCGSVDICLIADTSISDVVSHFKRVGVPIAEGPVARTGATGPLESVYIRDPDQNLVEISNYK